ncbi:GDSL-type esterase/lipase family protein [Microbacter margulisiae]|uniref:Lysophospholipase L1-like esterase n=1 Tax=Microbacter margulisiae TaxID=1350067 RepID=A0A7W5H3K5_9PORP|nr:GDSL-type esterase/lipase family protein [Microbacter margulisiae]MBB3188704.1 lysophospholipase L1-like esterase [Microbacter margulisiae]
MKTVLVSIFVLCNVWLLQANPHQYSTFYYQRATLFAQLPVYSSDIIFLGNSITNGCEWSELFNNKHVKNRGISGDIVQGVYDRLEPILKGQPEKIFLLIGINDLARGTSPDSVVRGIHKIADRVKRESPRTKLFIQSLLPVNNTFSTFKDHTSKGQEVIDTNKMLQALCLKKHLTYIDLYDSFKEPGDDKMNPKYTNDGLHLLGPGYLLWKKIIIPYIR